MDSGANIEFYIKAFWYLIGLIVAMATVLFNFVLKDQKKEMQAVKHEVEDSIVKSLGQRIRNLEYEIASVKSYNKDSEALKDKMEKLIEKLSK